MYRSNGFNKMGRGRVLCPLSLGSHLVVSWFLLLSSQTLNADALQMGYFHFLRSRFRLDLVGILFFNPELRVHRWFGAWFTAAIPECPGSRQQYRNVLESAKSAYSHHRHHCPWRLRATHNSPVSLLSQTLHDIGTRELPCQSNAI